NEWLPWAGTNAYFPYNLLQYDAGIPVVTGGADLQALNLLIAPMYAWLYRFTGLQQYQLEGDAIWASGVNDPTSEGISWSGKNFRAFCISRTDKQLNPNSSQSNNSFSQSCS